MEPDYWRAREALLRVRELPGGGAVASSLYDLIGSGDPETLPLLAAATVQAEALIRNYAQTA